ncbi:pyruvate kinase [Acidipila sp. EB88]|uniref:pyruvate kinase n=1 Tax=Acidipila sp. EB88 TaxID=2305226 RepID=UPI000F5DB2D4|nr:pyruvate kinase [Acidipila sp. EB88]RRA48692.1 pyruvate kinase [Acidipila sp. EB88]
MTAAQIHNPFSATGELRRAKIVATLGPASNTEATFRTLVRAGLDVARLNFSHGTQADKQILIDMIRKVSEEEGKHICILADLQGPKIRTGKLENRTPVLLEAGQMLRITPREIAGTKDLIATTFLTLAENLESGDRILLSDGLIELHVLRIDGEDVECTVINGGLLGENKGINLPGIAAKVPSLTDKDAEDLEFVMGAGVDAIALSFVRNAEDVRLVKDRITAFGADIWIIAKLEKPQAIDNVDEILEIADGVMVARGDLGVEVPPEKVPAMQKLIIRRAAEYRKPVITATQMLESMIDNPRPTRAEASDVANAVYDGTDAVMLSAESAAGKYPVEAVKMMSKIVLETEAQMRDLPLQYPLRTMHHASTVPESICESMAHAANDLDIRAIAVFTETGGTARLLSKRMPKPPICALSSQPSVLRRMSLLRGVFPIACGKAATTERMIETVESALEASQFARRGDIVGIVAGTRTNSGSTNFMRMHVLGDLVETAPAAKKEETHA